MKIASVLVALAGVVALIFGIVERALHTFIVQVAPMSFLNLAATLFLLALVIIAFDKVYGKKPQ
jgi:hypothetical protein